MRDQGREGLIATPVPAASVAASDPYRAMFEGLRQIVWLLTPDGAIERFNPFWTEYTGLPDVIEGLSWAAVFHPEDRQRLVSARTAGIASCAPYEVEARMRRVDGTYRRHLCRVAPLREGGNLTG